MRRGLVVLAVLVAAWLVACCFLFLWPSAHGAKHADVLVVLAGDAGRRIPRGLDLFRGGVAPTLALSRETTPGWRKRWGPLCGKPHVTCFRADPYSTRGEAETVSRLARRHGWHTAVIVTSRYHVFRAGMLFRRCFPGRVTAAPASYDRRWLPVLLPLETGKLVVAETFERGC